MTRALAEVFEAAAALVAAAVRDGSVPGAAFAVATTDDLFAEAFGTADPSTRRPATVDTPFCLASTTKPVTSLVLGSVLDDHLVSLDQAVALPPGPLHRRWPQPPATLRQLVDHTAGLGIHHRFHYEGRRTPVAPADAVSQLAVPAWPAGGRWVYSNLGYAVVQLELERAAGRPMAELVAERVAAPLGLATLAWGGPNGPDGAAVRVGPEGRTYPGYTTDHPAASEAWCGVVDLARLGLAQLGRSLLRPATHDLLVTPSAPEQPDGAAYGLGWITRRVGHGGEPLWVHAGRMGGVSAHLTIVPSAGVVIAAVANIETEVLGHAVATVVGALVDGYEPPAPAPAWTVGAAHPDLARRWIGELQLGDDRREVVVDAASPTMTCSIGSATAPLVSPHVQPERVAAHANLRVDLPLAPDGALGHLDLVPHDGSLVGVITLAQYPNGDRWWQGDAVSAAVVLDPS